MRRAFPIQRRHFCLSLAGLPWAARPQAALAAPFTRPPASSRLESQRLREDHPPANRGIYVNQTTVHDGEKLQGLIRLCSSFMVETMVVDLWSRSNKDEEAARAIQGAGLCYVPRIQVFPEGGTEREVLRRDYWDMRWRSVEAALELGAKRVQLDYIRYNLDRPADRQNVFDILKVLQFFAEKIRERGAKLEIDIFGDAASSPLDVIGQDLRLMGEYVDGICPMVYPSHFEPHDQTWKMPYHIVNRSIKNAHRLLGDRKPDIVAYVEMFNMRRRMTDEQRAIYVRRQIQGAVEGGACGWYAWSSTNSYGLLFDLLAAYGRNFERVEDPEVRRFKVPDGLE